jgi:hypothetical protein
LAPQTKAQTTSNEVWTKKNAKKWFIQKEWLGGLQLEPGKTVNVQQFARNSTSEYEADN